MTVEEYRQSVPVYRRYERFDARLIGISLDVVAVEFALRDAPVVAAPVAPFVKQWSLATGSVTRTVNQVFADSDDCDLNRPVLIAEVRYGNGVYHVLTDGAHRMYKAHQMGLETVLAKIIPPDVFDLYNDAAQVIGIFRERATSPFG